MTWIIVISFIEGVLYKFFPYYVGIFINVFLEYSAEASKNNLLLTKKQ